LYQKGITILSGNTYLSTVGGKSQSEE